MGLFQNEPPTFGTRRHRHASRRRLRHAPWLPHGPKRGHSQVQLRPRLRLHQQQQLRPAVRLGSRLLHLHRSWRQSHGIAEADAAQAPLCGVEPVTPLFSLWGVSVAVPYIFNSLTQKGFHYTVCADEIRFGPGSLCDSAMGLAMTLFMFSKIPELFDTVFLVLMKKKIMTPQWWHHATVLLYSWWSAMNALPSCGPMAAMNYSVHGIMYFYFAVSGYTRAFSFLRLPVMLMQLSQM